MKPCPRFFKSASVSFQVQLSRSIARHGKIGARAGQLAQSTCLTSLTVFWVLAFFLSGSVMVSAGGTSNSGTASWYGEDHRGRLMANGKKFNPDQLTAASWFYPLGTKVRVTVRSPKSQPKSVVVRITDRGPAMDLVRDGRIIDLTHAAFSQLSSPDRGLVAVEVKPVPKTPRHQRT